MKIKEVRELSTEELNNQVYSLKEQLFNLRRKKAVGNLDNMLELKRVRKDIARIYTVLRERELGMNKEGN
ncbi:MAG: 50S ribosomal protein L29 [bacterium]|nr:50S ribosomal protein L29 [bacterium]